MNNTLHDLQHVEIKKIKDMPSLEWSMGLTVSIPKQLVTHLLPHSYQDKHLELSLNTNAITAEIVKLCETSLNKIRLQSAFTNIQPLSSRLPLNYQLIPAIIRDAIAHTTGRLKRAQTAQWSKFPNWPLDLSADFIADLAGIKPTPFKNKPTPVLLTHDLDSPEGLKNLSKYFLDIEEVVGARSCNYIVPCAWPIDHAVLQNVLERGHEIGVHGFDHSNKTPFVSPIERQKRLLAAESLITRYKILGYRAPSLLRTKELLQDLNKLYQYDSSIPSSGGPFPVPNNGCATARPFKVEGIWEIPITLPRDGSLLFLGYSYKEILDIWIYCADLISKSGGIVHLLTHCENRFSGKPSMREIYTRFINHIANNKQFQFMLPREVLPYLEEKH